MWRSGKRPYDYTIGGACPSRQITAAESDCANTEVNSKHTGVLTCRTGDGGGGGHELELVGRWYELRGTLRRIMTGVFLASLRLPPFAGGARHVDGDGRPLFLRLQLHSLCRRHCLLVVDLSSSSSLPLAVL